MSRAAKTFYNQLVVEKMANSAFRIEVVEHYYETHFTKRPDWSCQFPVGEVSQELKDIVAFVNESDFILIINKYKEIFGPKTESEVYVDKFMKLLSGYQIPIKP